MELQYVKFSDINLSDPFFDSLRLDYCDFNQWFNTKLMGGESAYVVKDKDNSVQGFLYLKIEDEEHADIEPPLSKQPRIKVGTLKINAHGTRLGQRFIKKVTDHAIDAGVDEIYLTIFPKHEALLKILKVYGFYEFGLKRTKYGEEIVLLKKLSNLSDDIIKNYPIITCNKSIYMLSILPIYHTRLFPDSKLVTESPDIISDSSETNSIHKIYLCNMVGVEKLQYGDVIVIYRTKDGGSAEYTSVATSLCMVEEIKSIYDFNSENEFINYANKYSVFNEHELKRLWQTKSYPKIIRFTYNLNLKKRPIRKVLIEDIGLDRNDYFGFLRLTETQLKKIAAKGQINENTIVYKT